MNTKLDLRVTLRDSMSRAPRAATSKRWSPVPALP